MELNKIYLGDCYELIKQVQDKSVDLVIIDPPYEFVPGGKGSGGLADRKDQSKTEIYSLDTELTKKEIQTGGGCLITGWFVFNNNYEGEPIVRFIDIDNYVLRRKLCHTK